MATHDDLNDGAFTDALEQFDPSAEPFANMSRGRIREVMDARFAKNDLRALQVCVYARNLYHVA